MMEHLYTNQDLLEEVAQLKSQLASAEQRASKANQIAHQWKAKADQLELEKQLTFPAVVHNHYYGKRKKRHSVSRGGAALINLFLPGVGHMFRGQVIGGFIYLCFTSGLYITNPVLGIVFTFAAFLHALACLED